MASTNKEVLKMKDLMEFMGIGKDKAYGLVSLKDFPATKVGREYFVVRDSLIDWLKENEGRSIDAK